MGSGLNYRVCPHSAPLIAPTTTFSSVLYLVLGFKAHSGIKTSTKTDLETSEHISTSQAPPPKNKLENIEMTGKLRRVGFYSLGADALWNEHPLNDTRIPNMSYSLNSSKGDYIGAYVGEDYSAY